MPFRTINGKKVFIHTKRRSDRGRIEGISVFHPNITPQLRFELIDDDAESVLATSDDLRALRKLQSRSFPKRNTSIES